MIIPYSQKELEEFFLKQLPDEVKKYIDDGQLGLIDTCKYSSVETTTGTSTFRTPLKVCDTTIVKKVGESNLNFATVEINSHFLLTGVSLLCRESKSNIYRNVTSNFPFEGELSIKFGDLIVLNRVPFEIFRNAMEIYHFAIPRLLHPYVEIDCEIYLSKPVEESYTFKTLLYGLQLSKI